jgi:hypothetical protein
MTKRQTLTFPDEKVPDSWTNERLAKQAMKDLREDWLWQPGPLTKGEDRASYRKTLQDHLTWWENDELNEKGRLGMWRIVHHNNMLRDKKRKLEASAVALAPVPPLLPPPVAEHETNATIESDPPLTAMAIGIGWGFKNGQIVDRMQRRFPEDFPKPFPFPLRKRKSPLYRSSDIAAFARTHHTDLQAARLGQRMRKVDAVKDTLAKQAEEITRLQAENARLQAENARLRKAK